MTTTTTPSKPTNRTKSNGTNPEETSEQPPASTSPAASESATAVHGTSAKMISISLPSSVHTKLKLLASLTERSASQIATEAVGKVIQAELRAALAKVDLDG